MGVRVAKIFFMDWMGKYFWGRAGNIYIVVELGWQSLGVGW